MKILIIEDDEMPAFLMSIALSDLGDVEVCTTEMPTLEEIRVKILEADVVLLDGYLRTSYEGRDLLPFCNGKIVIGTSTSECLGLVQFSRKNSLNENKNCPAARELRDLVSSQLSGK